MQSKQTLHALFEKKSSIAHAHLTRKEKYHGTHLDLLVGRACIIFLYF